MYHLTTAKGTLSPLQPSDGMVLVIGPRLAGHSVIFLAIQTHPSGRFLRAVDSLGLRRSASLSQCIDRPQDFSKQVPGHGVLGQLERDVPAMADSFGPDLDRLLALARMRPVLDLLRQVQCLFWVNYGSQPRPRKCPFLGVEQTSISGDWRSACSHKQTLGAPKVRSVSRIKGSH